MIYYNFFRMFVLLETFSQKLEKNTKVIVNNVNIQNFVLSLFTCDIRLHRGKNLPPLNKKRSPYRHTEPTV